MAYSEHVAQRVRACLSGYPHVREQKMFGGIAFMLAGNMCVGVLGEMLMARVGPEQYGEALLQPHARPMDFTGRSMRGFVYVEPEGFADEADLQAWLARCVRFAESLPPK